MVQEGGRRCSTPDPSKNTFNEPANNSICTAAIQRAERLKERQGRAMIAEGETRLDPNKTTGKKK